MNQINSSSQISNNVDLGENIKIGPFCHLDGNIKIGDNTELKSNVCIYGNVNIGTNNKIYPFSNIGCDPQDLKFDGEDSSLEIGNNNIIRENVTISKGTKGDNLITKIGDSNLFMTGTHVAHDCIIGDNNIFANQATLAGHVKIIDNIIIGGLSAIQQFITIGSFSMIGGMSGVDKNIMPASLVIGNRAKLRGLNLVGLRRSDFNNKEIRIIEDIHKDIKILKELKLSKTNNKIVEIFDNYLKLQNKKIGTIRK